MHDNVMTEMLIYKTEFYHSIFITTQEAIFKNLPMPFII